MSNLQKKSVSESVSRWRESPEGRRSQREGGRLMRDLQGWKEGRLIAIRVPGKNGNIGRLAFFPADFFPPEGLPQD
jgi:hypothetical protein